MCIEEIKKEAFRKIFFLLVIISSVWLISCDLNVDNSTNCDDTLIVDRAELFVTFDINGILQFGSTPESTEFVSCDPFPIDFQGYEGIYLVTGTLFTNCEDGPCMEVESISVPDCPADYEINRESQFGLFGPWKFGYELHENDTIHPPCRNENLIFSIQRDVISNSDYPHFLSSTMVTNTIEFFFQLKEDTIIRNDLIATNELTSPYSEIVEDRILNFLLENDTMLYVLRFNELEFQSVDGSAVMRLYQEE